MSASDVPPSFPSNLARQLGLLAQQCDWWSYRQLHALGENLVEPNTQLQYTSYYRPVIPLNNQQPRHLQVGSEHYFEWLVLNTDFTIVAFHLIINPLVHTHNPLFTITAQSYQPYPLITCIWHDCPNCLNTLTSNFIGIHLLNNWGRESYLDIFEEILNCFFTAYCQGHSAPCAPRLSLDTTLAACPVTGYNTSSCMT